MDYNKKEQLLDKINGLRLTSTNASDTLYNRGVVDAFRRTNEFFDEELIPEVPQYVIDWYEENKDSLDYNLWNFIKDWEDQEDDEFKNWFNNSKEAFQTIINMHQFGYKIKKEKEKKYLVKMKGFSGYGRYLNKALSSGEYFFGSKNEVEVYRTKHTRKELEKNNFGWVFSCEGVEVEEVEK